jgi:hypothetical protein
MLNNDIPPLVSHWEYWPEEYSYHVTLFNDTEIVLDRYEVLDSACKNYHHWDSEKEAMAIESYVDRHKEFYFN